MSKTYIFNGQADQIVGRNAMVGRCIAVGETVEQPFQLPVSHDEYKEIVAQGGSNPPKIRITIELFP